MGFEFYQTVMGRKFFESQFPEMIRSLNRLAAAVEKQNELAEMMVRGHGFYPESDDEDTNEE